MLLDLGSFFPKRSGMAWVPCTLRRSLSSPTGAARLPVDPSIRLWSLRLRYLNDLQGTGLWPFVSYTAISYMLLTLRFAFVFAGLQAAAEILRFPVIAMATVTSTVWWLVLLLCSNLRNVPSPSGV